MTPAAHPPPAHPHPVRRQRIVIASSDTFGPRMAGPAIRCLHMAVALSGEHDVHLLSLAPTCELTDDRFMVSRTDLAGLARAGADCDVLVIQGDLLARCPSLKDTRAVVVCDLYDPFHLEQLEQARDLGEATRREVVRLSTVTLNEQALRGDFFLCASDKQRDFWLGTLAALGRVNPVTYDADETLRALIDVVPFGIEARRPEHRTQVAKGVLPGVPVDAELLLWGGGVYNWFDPVTLVEAVHALRERRPLLRLVFLGMKHPNAEVPQMRAATALRRRCTELGLAGIVHLNEQWVAYEDRQDWLLESDVGVSTHLDHVETAFSFRTRVLDYLWAGLPVITTAGDTLAAVVEDHGLGLTVPAGDVQALATAIDRVLGDVALRDSCRAAVAHLQPQLTWDVALAPLVQFCRDPRRAPDLLDRGVVAGTRQPLRHPRAGAGWLRQDARKVVELARDGGGRLLAERMASRLRHRLAGRR